MCNIALLQFFLILWRHHNAGHLAGVAAATSTAEYRDVCLGLKVNSDPGHGCFHISRRRCLNTHEPDPRPQDFRTETSAIHLLCKTISRRYVCVTDCRGSRNDKLAADRQSKDAECSAKDELHVKSRKHVRSSHVPHQNQL